MARLRIYTVHVNPSLPHPYEEAKFVGDGFSKAAFLFTSLWALYHRMWGRFALLLVYNFTILNIFYYGALSHLGTFIVDIGVHIWIGFEANDWLRAKLTKRGYLTVDIASGDSPLRAEQRFFDRYLAMNPSAALL